MKIPSESDINVYNSLDEITARDHFLNKSTMEATNLFRENSVYYLEDLMWMGPHAFTYYIQAAIDYLQSDDSVGEDHFVDSLYEVIRFRESQKGFSESVERVKHLADYVIRNYSKFNIDETVYGNLLQKYQQLLLDLE